MTDPQLCSKYWLVRKVICLVGYYGGLRNVELKSLVFENVEADSMGYWFTFTRSKQRNKLEETTICVPRRQKDWIPCSEDSGRRPLDYDPASVVDTYFEAVMQDLDCKRENLSGCLFKGTHGKDGKRFIRANVGKNTLALVGIEIASELCLRDPETFAGHCWRRSAGTNASNAGVNVTTLMAIMGWSCPKTAMQYVKRSRITSLKMSMYLANVQRRNCSDPFPNGKGRSSRKTKFSDGQKSNLNPDVALSHSSFIKDKNVTSVNVTPQYSALKSVESPNSSCDVDKFESEICTQDLLCDNFVECADAETVGVNESEQSTITSSHLSVSDALILSSSTLGSSSSAVPNSGTPTASVSARDVDLSTIDPRLINVLQNLHNHGTIQMHFNFGDVKK